MNTDTDTDTFSLTPEYPIGDSCRVCRISIPEELVMSPTGRGPWCMTDAEKIFPAEYLELFEPLFTIHRIPNFEDRPPSVGFRSGTDDIGLT